MPKSRKWVVWCISPRRVSFSWIQRNVCRNLPTGLVQVTSAKQQVGGKEIDPSPGMPGSSVPCVLIGDFCFSQFVDT